MTCVLPVSTVHTFKAEFTEMSKQKCGTLNDLSDKNACLSSTVYHKRASACHQETCKRKSIDYPREVFNGPQETIEYHDHFNSGEVFRNDILNHSDNQVPQIQPDNQHSRKMIEGGNDADTETNTFKNVKKGTKRKVENTTVDENYVPYKRISPYLNTAKERKDIRKKVLKLSIEKLKGLDDPEYFLRRTVLVNNTMKQLQNEVYQEQVKTKYIKSLRQLGLQTNKCTSDFYLFDDPFLSGNNEKITDDMTNILITNVFESNERIDNV